MSRQRVPAGPLSTEALQRLDRTSIVHPYAHLRAHTTGVDGEPHLIVGGEGIHVRERDGRELIDAFAGSYCVHVGYGRREIIAAIQHQAQELAYFQAYSGFSNEPAIRLADRLLSMTPGAMKRIYFGLSGSDANETLIKIVWCYNNARGQHLKKKIISRWRGYHGGTIMTASLTGLDTFHRAFDLPKDPVLHTITPHYFWHAERGMTEREFSHVCAARLEALIQTEGYETVAAFMAEPVLGTGGLIPPPEGYWEAIQEVLKRYDVLLIADEVICGFGRLGAAFGSQVYGIEPDLITVGKGLTSGYLPLSGALIGEKVWRVLQDNGSDAYGIFGHGYTFSGHPLCAAAALANLDVLEQEKLYEHVVSITPYFQQRLRESFTGRPYVAEVRGAGLLGAIEFALNPAQRVRFDPGSTLGPRLAAACLKEGVIVRAMPHGDILGLAPPLIITRAEIDEVVTRVARAVERVTASL